MQAVSDYTTQRDFEEGAAVGRVIDLYWHDIPRAMLTLFGSITGGMNWRQAVEPLEKVRADLNFVFVTFIALSLFAVLNVMTGVFCHEAIENAQRQSDLKISRLMKENAENISAIRQVFSGLDHGNSGVVSLRQLSRLYNNEALASFLATLDLEPSDLGMLFNILDEDRSDTIDQDEFISGCLRLKGSAKAFDLAALRYEQKRITEKLCDFMVFVEQKFESHWESSASNDSEARAGAPHADFGGVGPQP
mmetsp:Transcript_141356/g.352481  ORF Transcript_141356/g.352481 Transcript_141356/m.352481 type:complete len:249 (+) Transcript_141356:2-748(+)